MRYLLISVRDNAIEAFQPIACVRAKGEGTRSFQDAINNPQNKQLNDHPEDFDLYLVGYMDDQTGLIEHLDAPERLARGLDVRIKS